MKSRKSINNSVWYLGWINSIKSIFPEFTVNPDKNSSSVKSYELNNAAISALIKDSSNNSYNTIIAIRRFSEDENLKLKQVINNLPTLAYEINIGSIPDRFISILEDAQINVFPESIAEFSIKCSCNESGCCEHISALLYYISSEISKNPYILLELRGISHSKITEITDFVDESKCNSSKLTGKLIPFEEVFFERINTSAYKDNYLFIPNDIENMFDLLTSNPVFFEKSDIKARLKTIYEVVVSEAGAVINKENVTPARDLEFYFYIQNNGNYKIFITPSNNFLYYLKSKGSRYKYQLETLNVPQIKDNQVEFIKKEGLFVDTEIVFDYFLALPGIDDTSSETAQFLFYMANFATELVKSGLFLPNIVYIENNNFKIQYVPFKNQLIDKELAYLEETVPNILGFSEDKVLTYQAYGDVLSLYLTHIIHKIAFLRTSKIKPNNISNLFMKDQLLKTHNDTKNIAKSISLWLAPLGISNTQIRIILRIETLSSNKYTLNLDFIDKNDVFVSFSEIANNKDLITEITRQILTASEYLPEIASIYDSKGQNPPELTINDVFSIISGKAFFLNKYGISVVIPKELKEIPRPKLSIKAKYKHKKLNLSEFIDKKGSSSISMDDLFDFQYEIAIGDQKISREEFLNLVKSTEEIVKYNSQYILLDQDNIKLILDNLNKPVPEFNNINEFIHSALSGHIDDVEFNYDEAFERVLEDLEEVKDVSLPKNLKGQLRPYQERGFKWLYSNTLRGFGSCIADDMGLGKTVQALSLILKLKEENRLDKTVLVICPTTLVGNWQKECQKFAPTLSTSIFHGTERVLELENSDLIITTYGLLRQDIEEFKDKDWSLVIVDEAQNIKNPDTAQTNAVKSLKAEAHIAMTGTPVENRLAELWSIFDFINKGYLKSLNNFQNNYAVPIEKQRDPDAINRLKKVTSPFVLRRLKSDKTIIDDLPEKIIIDEYCYLSKEQAALYEKTLNDSMNNIEKSQGINRRGLIFKLITALKQICNHPAHYTKGNNLSRELSGKTDKTLDLIQNIIEIDEKALIFTQYKEMGNLLVNILKNELQEDALFFHGTIQRTKRDELIEQFQTDPESKLMVISLKAGGTGLNLTAATNVIHYDLWWNPAVEDQATDRAYRIGQTKNVNVHRLVTIGTFEEKIDEMIKNKKELANLTISTGENWITELSNKELKEIFSLSKE